MNKTLIAAVNKQIQHEESNVRIYQAMSLYFERQNLPGFSAWFNKQAGDERTHASHLIKVLQDRHAVVELGALGAPKNEYASALEAVKAALALEKGTTKAVYDLYAAATKEGDLALQLSLNFLVEEQVEEEQWAVELLGLVEQFGANPAHLFMLDHRWGKKAAGGQG